MTLLTITEAQAKDALEKYLNQARHEPVLIENAGGEGLILVDSTEYKRLRAMDEAYWRMKESLSDSSSGSVGEMRANAFIQRRQIDD